MASYKYIVCFLTHTPYINQIAFYATIMYNLKKEGKIRRTFNLTSSLVSPQN